MEPTNNHFYKKLIKIIKYKYQVYLYFENIYSLLSYNIKCIYTLNIYSLLSYKYQVYLYF